MLALLEIFIEHSLHHEVDFLNGLGMGWAWPFSSIALVRKVYSPGGTAGASAAQ
jgi:hypothetical protein